MKVQPLTGWFGEIRVPRAQTPHSIPPPSSVGEPTPPEPCLSDGSPSLSEAPMPVVTWTGDRHSRDPTGRGDAGRRVRRREWQPGHTSLTPVTFFNFCKFLLECS